MLCPYQSRPHHSSFNPRIQRDSASRLVFLRTGVILLLMGVIRLLSLSPSLPPNPQSYTLTPGTVSSHQTLNFACMAGLPALARILYKDEEQERVTTKPYPRLGFRVPHCRHHCVEGSLGRSWGFSRYITNLGMPCRNSSYPHTTNVLTKSF